jgi:hypothetical protein
VTSTSAKYVTWGGFVLVLIGMLLPWTRIEPYTRLSAWRPPTVGGSYEEWTIEGDVLSGWATQLSLRSVSLPGWSVAVAAFASAVLVSFRERVCLPRLLSLYGVFYVALIFYNLITNLKMNPSYGIAIALMGFFVQVAGVTVFWSRPQS